MYHFVLVEELESGHKVWYLKPNSEEQVLEHFKTVFRNLIKEGIRDFVDQPFSHPNTLWRIAVTKLQYVYGEGSFIVASMRAENDALRSRLSLFRDGVEFFLPEGIACYILDERFYRVVQEIDKETLEYPQIEKYTFEDVRFLKWGDSDFLGVKGVHWYAKVRNEDVKDKNGNTKWNTRQEAEEAAKWFISELNNKRTVWN